MTKDILALNAKNEKLQSETKIAVRQAKAEVELEWEKITSLLDAKIQILEALERMLKADMEEGKDGYWHCEG